MGPTAVPGLIHLLNTKDTGLRKLTWSLAKRLPRKPRAFFFTKFPWPDPNDACIAGAKGLGIIGPEASAAVPALARALHSPVREVSLEAATALGRIGPVSVPPLIKALSDKDPEVRHLAAFSLGEIGPAARAAVPHLVPLLAENNESLRSSTAYSLSRIGSTEPPPVLDLLTNGDTVTRQAAAQVLLQYYVSLQGAITVLEKLTHDQSAAVRDQAIQNLAAAREGNRVALELAVRALKDQDVQVRIRALTILAQPAEHTQAEVGPLIECPRDKSASLRAGAAQILGEMGAVATPSIPALQAAQQDQDETVRKTAQETLKRLQPGSASTPVRAEVGLPSAR